MTTTRDGLAGILIFALVVLAGSTLVALAFRATGLSVGDARAVPLVYAAMWMPALARLVATRTADRGWRSPLSVRQWGSPRLLVVALPLVIVSAIYLAAYTVGWALGVSVDAPVWHGRVAVNVAVNLPLGATIGVFGALGEEIGWTGYLQPRLDQLRVAGALLWRSVLGSAFHIPLILMGGYLASASTLASIALMFGLGFGIAVVWTWAAYRWRTIWMAVWFHAFHNTVSQVLLPKALGAGSPLVLDESGILPVAIYLAAAGVIIGVMRARGVRWRDLVDHAISRPRRVESRFDGRSDGG